MMGSRGELAIVLHTHMPYVEGFGTWPFGEEWLWEAVATSYLPLLEVLGRAPLTLSLTPVLCDQLERPEAMRRCRTFLDKVRPESHRRDIAELRTAGAGELADELERSAADYAGAADALAGLEDGAGLLAALGEHVAWTSAATHAVLPLLATDAAIALQVQTGIASHRRRFRTWAGGFWLPECAHAPWVDEPLEEAGVRATCVELTGRFGLGDDRHLHPLVSEDGPVLWPIDRQTIDLVWSERGYPAAAAYRDHHHHSAHRHRAWANGGGAYHRVAAAAQVRADARDFVARTVARVAGGGVCVCAIDTELLGHWWFEGVDWLRAVLDESARQRLTLTTLDDALTRHAPAPAPADLAPGSWGEGGDLRTWSGPRAADLAWRARTAELALAAALSTPSQRAQRELLALQSSDWMFLVSGGQAGDYPRDRAEAHHAALARALAGDGGDDPKLSGLAPDLTGWS